MSFSSLARVLERLPWPVRQRTEGTLEFCGTRVNFFSKIRDRTDADWVFAAHGVSLCDARYVLSYIIACKISAP